MSKFDFGMYFDEDNDYFVVSRERYTEKEAIELAKNELKLDESKTCLEMLNGLWFMFKNDKPSCPCWVFCVKKL